MLKTIFRMTFGIIFAAVWFCEAISITVEWEPAQTTVNGDPLEEIHYYKLFYGTTSGRYTDYITVTNGTSVRLTDLEYNKTLYFCVRTCSGPVESDYSEELFWTAPVMPDSDFDGLSDDWETFYFGSLHRAGSSTDSDGNGVIDLEEFIAGTDPMNPSDRPILRISPDGAVYFFAEKAGGSGYENRTRKYRLLHSSSLVEGNWTPVPDMDDIQAENQLVTCGVPMDGAPGYYRTEIYLD